MTLDMLRIECKRVGKPRPRICLEWSARGSGRHNPGYVEDGVQEGREAKTPDMFRMECKRVRKP